MLGGVWSEGTIQKEPSERPWAQCQTLAHIGGSYEMFLGLGLSP